MADAGFEAPYTPALGCDKAGAGADEENVPAPRRSWQAAPAREVKRRLEVHVDHGVDGCGIDVLKGGARQVFRHC